MAGRNEFAWEEIEDLTPFRCTEQTHLHIEAWKWLEALEKGQRLRQLDILRLRSLIEAVYDIGVADGRAECREELGP